MHRTLKKKKKQSASQIRFTVCHETEKDSRLKSLKMENWSKYARLTRKKPTAYLIYINSNHTEKKLGYTN